MASCAGSSDGGTAARATAMCAAVTSVAVNDSRMAVSAVMISYWIFGAEASGVLRPAARRMSARAAASGGGT